MTILTPIDPGSLATRLKAGDATLIDIREADEYAREHIDGAVSMPLSKIEAGHLTVKPQGMVVFHCRSGMRTNANCEKLAACVEGGAFILTGGIEAWKKAGLPVAANKSAPLEMNRQVQIMVGSLVLIGVLLTLFVHPGFVFVPAFLGAGLLFAGVSGWCGMARLLALMPWNSRA